MAASQLLAVGNTAANSPDFTVGQGESVTICLKGGDGTGEVSILLRDDAGSYVYLQSIGKLGVKAICIMAPGTYRVSRMAGSNCGVFRA